MTLPHKALTDCNDEGIFGVGWQVFSMHSVHSAKYWSIADIDVMHAHNYTLLLVFPLSLRLLKVELLRGDPCSAIGLLEEAEVSSISR